MLKNLLEYYENFEWIPGQTPFSASWHPIVWSMLYLIVIYGLKYYMKNKVSFFFFFFFQMNKKKIIRKKQMLDFS